MGISVFNRLMGFASFLMETAGNTWVSLIRRQTLTTFLGQEKERHDKGKNAGARMVADSGEGRGGCSEFGGGCYGGGVCNDVGRGGGRC